MKIFCGVLFATFLLLSQAFPAQPNPSSPSLSFIYNGDPAEVGEFPHQLMMESIAPGEWTFSCGAVLISKDQALTAAHCIIPFFLIPFSYRVLAGVHDKLDLEEVQTVMIKSAVPHPAFVMGLIKIENDIAVLTFNTSLELNDKVQPIAWNQNDNLNFMGEQCEISGWGRLWEFSQTNYTEDFLVKPNILHKATMNILSNDNCEEIMKVKMPVITEGHICPYNPDQGFARGDSGGPLTCKHNGQPILAGIGSFMKGMSHFHPSGYARVSYFKDFINDNLVD